MGPTLLDMLGLVGALLVSSAFALPPHRGLEIPVKRKLTQDGLLNERLRKRTNVAVDTWEINGFYLDLTIGATKYTNLLIDTGSAVTFVSPYTGSSTATNTGVTFKETFADGSVATGTIWEDQVEFGGIKSKLAFGGYPSKTRTAPIPNDKNGIFSMGTEQDLSTVLINAGTQHIGTIPAQLAVQKIIPANLIQLKFIPDGFIGESTDGGAMSLGAIDTTFLTSPITYTPRLPGLKGLDGKIIEYWAASVELPSLGLLKTNANKAFTLIDSGTTYTQIFETPFKTWLAKIPGAFYNATAGATQIPKTSLAKIPALDWTIEGKTFTVSGQALLVGDAVVSGFNLNPAYLWSYVQSTGSDAGMQILGTYSLTYISVILDASSAVPRLGFAKTKYSPA
ncbi:uncharacterized protein L969DRAFT_16163 [Mixia osmundae IAM 14324]|uniref:Peptidase A1 domain-containing protein n=1 Tax=Mixia osmundae (strain CBS 9802 / IAM 14324 / JCM 22182 / KY 12970) TaxID=764103 RepID=G7E5D8_MIXOS|nr:uncharacterized protein L969DRAFT_16163 [Mixia osmundae IAM 14324]KEI40801.1 hypothetical protein L969DRAFT_16163 [Mixia osmundae IAM 14324]GAA98048.1 hypothetical protein E5Q_04729 [Mixia osmundae IAM 14324]